MNAISKFSLPLALFCLVFLFGEAGAKIVAPGLESADTPIAQFKKITFTEEQSGKSLQAQFFSPSGKVGEKLPLAMFLGASASTGNPASFWTSPEAQAASPCFVLAPELAGQSDGGPSPDMLQALAQLILKLIKEEAIDARRVYAIGLDREASMAIRLLVHCPKLIAAGIFVNCSLQNSNLDELIKHDFILVNSNPQGEPGAEGKALEEAAAQAGRAYAWASWPAGLPLSGQDDLAATMLAKGAPINLFTLEMPADDGDARRAFENLFKLGAIRDWLFRQVLK